jgi:hypothetical protein
VLPAHPAAMGNDVVKLSMKTMGSWLALAKKVHFQSRELYAYKV